MYNEALEAIFDDYRKEGEAKGRAEGEAKGRAEGEAKGRVEGRAEGKTEGILQTLIGLVKKGMLTLSQAADEAGMSVSEFENKTGLKA